MLMETQRVAIENVLEVAEKLTRNAVTKIYIDYYLFLFQVFIGSSNPHEATFVSLGAVIFGRHVRVVPQSWHRHICMRVELYGCQGGWMFSSANNVTSVSVMQQS